VLLLDSVLRGYRYWHCTVVLQLLLLSFYLAIIWFESWIRRLIISGIQKTVQVRFNWRAFVCILDHPQARLTDSSTAWAGYPPQKAQESEKVICVSETTTYRSLLTFAWPYIWIRVLQSQSNKAWNIISHNCIAHLA
jgi:hypothetical protein